jgi:hypothetical protein
MDTPASGDRVTIHVKTDRHVRDRLLGALRATGMTMQQFIDQLMQALVTHPERIEDIQRWNADVPQAARKAPGRPARVPKRRTPTTSP